MSKDDTESKKDPKKAFDDTIKSINGYEGTYKTYEESAEKTQVNRKDKLLTKNQLSVSLLEGATSTLKDHLGADDKERLLTALSSSIQESSGMITEKEFNTLKTNIARTEANLKGCPVLERDLEKANLKGLNKEEYKEILSITDQVLVELSGQKIPEAKFTEKVASRVKEEAEKKFSNERMDEVNKVIDIKQKKSTRGKFDDTQLDGLDKAASKATEHLIGKLETNRQEAQTLSLTQDVMQSLKNQGYKMSDSRSEKISKAMEAKLSESLKGLDPNYVQANREDIVKDLSKQISKQNSIWGKITNRIHTSTSKINKIEFPKQRLEAGLKAKSAALSKESPKETKKADGQSPSSPELPKRDNAPSAAHSAPERPERDAKKTPPPVPPLPPAAPIPPPLVGQAKQAAPQQPGRNASKEQSTPQRPERTQRQGKKQHDRINSPTNSSRGR